QGLKYSDDRSDARWLAEMLRLGIVPTGYIYPQAQRPLRDLLRQRSFLVRQGTGQLLHTGNILCRNQGRKSSRQQIRQMTVAGARPALGSATPKRKERIIVTTATPMWPGPMWKRPPTRHGSTGRRRALSNGKRLR